MDESEARLREIMRLRQVVGALEQQIKEKDARIQELIETSQKLTDCVELRNACDICCEDGNNKQCPGVKLKQIIKAAKGKIQ